MRVCCITTCLNRLIIFVYSKLKWKACLWLSSLYLIKYLELITSYDVSRLLSITFSRKRKKKVNATLIILSPPCLRSVLIRKLTSISESIRQHDSDRHYNSTIWFGRIDQIIWLKQMDPRRGLEWVDWADYDRAGWTEHHVSGG